MSVFATVEGVNEAAGLNLKIYTLLKMSTDDMQIIFTWEEKKVHALCRNECCRSQRGEQHHLVVFDEKQRIYKNSKDYIIDMHIANLFPAVHAQIVGEVKRYRGSISATHIK